MRRKNKLYWVLPILIVIILAGLVYFMFLTESSYSFNPGITAKEGKLIADDVAKNWCHNASLSDIGLYYNITKNDWDGWTYDYWNNSRVDFINSTITVIVNSNGDYFIEKRWLSISEFPIEDWVIDSDEAYEIAISQDEYKIIKEYDASIANFHLDYETGQYEGHKLIWNPWWDVNDKAIYLGRAEIDAMTGEVYFFDINERYIEANP